MIRDNAVILIAFIIVITGVVVYHNSNINVGFDVDVRLEKSTESSDFYDINVDRVISDVLGAYVVNDFVGDRVNEFKELAEREVPERRAGIKYSLDISIETYKSENYLSYAIFISEYTGGANVNQIVESFVFKKESGDVVEIGDVILDDNRSGFVESVKEKLIDKKQETGIFEDQVNSLDINSLDTFYVTEEGITVLFSKYEVAPGAAGIVSVQIPSLELNLLE